jgi:hypothetical protein
MIDLRTDQMNDSILLHMGSFFVLFYYIYCFIKYRYVLYKHKSLIFDFHEIKDPKIMLKVYLLCLKSQLSGKIIIYYHLFMICYMIFFYDYLGIFFSFSYLNGLMIFVPEYLKYIPS